MPWKDKQKGKDYGKEWRAKNPDYMKTYVAEHRAEIRKHKATAYKKNGSGKSYVSKDELKKNKLQEFSRLLSMGYSVAAASKEVGLNLSKAHGTI